MSVKIVTAPFDPQDELQQYQKQLRPGCFGAMTSFVGTLRDFNNDSTVLSMQLEHYPGMTEKQLDAIAKMAKTQWQLEATLLVHRVGKIRIGEPIVLTVAWATHRDAAFAGCRYLIDKLKTDAPFWKKEQLNNGTRWVSNNT